MMSEGTLNRKSSEMDTQKFDVQGDEERSPVTCRFIFFQRELFVSNLNVIVCTGMARFSQQRQSWTRQPTNVKVSKVINLPAITYQGYTIRKKSICSNITSVLLQCWNIMSNACFSMETICLVGASNCCFQLTFITYHTSVFCMLLHIYIWQHTCKIWKHTVLF